MEAIRWENHTLYLLDQTRLPTTEYWLRYTDPFEAVSYTHLRAHETR